MKNKIGILENDIYIFPIVNSVILLSVQFSHGLEGSTAYHCNIVIYFPCCLFNCKCKPLMTFFFEKDITKNGNFLLITFSLINSLK